MRAAVLTEYGEPLEIRDVDRPDASADGVVVETEACGICRSDWHGWQGDWDWLGGQAPTGQILGHEPAGTVVEVGDDVQTLDVGDRVAIPFNLADGTCHYCQTDRSNICENVKSLGFTPAAPGAFAEYVHVPSADFNAVTLPDGVSAVDMAGLGCRFMTAFHAIAHRADMGAGDWVAVHGCGGVGLSAVHIADALGAHVVAADIKAEKLELASDLGAMATVDAAAVDSVPREIMSITDGGADVSIDALGIAETAQNSVRGLRRSGQHLQVGLTSEEEQGVIPLETDMMVMKEIEFIGSFGMQPPRYDEIFRMVESGRLDPSTIVSETVPLEQVSEKLAAMTDYETMGIPVIDEF
jgi:D-arabinose 1-dehydrogenase-like Zn-dependent alcohol dehydrogenase